MLLKRGDLIQYNLSHGDNDWEPEWVMGLVIGPNPEDINYIQVLWFDDNQKTDEPNPQKDKCYRMFSPGSSAG